MATKASMTKYYYKTLVIKPKGSFNTDFPREKIEDDLNRLGDLGWELVSTTLQTYPYQLLFVLKNTEANLNKA